MSMKKGVEQEREIFPVQGRSSVLVSVDSELIVDNNAKGIEVREKKKQMCTLTKR